MVRSLVTLSKNSTKRLAFVSFLLTVFFLSNLCFADNYDHTYEILNHPGGSVSYQLTVSVTSSLFEYYQSKDHNLYSVDDFAKFVTPSALKPLADDLWSIYSDDEDFANGVLMFVHQIPYVESGPQKYPVETIVENEGDCDLLSFVAGSLMMAGGLDVVLLLYESQSHMNVGVSLSHEPDDARSAVYYYSHSGKRYYVAECTGDDWRDGWRVGESPSTLRGVSARIITLEGHEETSPGQVSSSYGITNNSSLSLKISSRVVIAGRPVTIGGSISPVLSDRNVTLYVSSSRFSWSVLARVTTDSDGRYSYMWTPSSGGSYSVRASWSGDTNYSGADSNGFTLFVVPYEWLMMGVAVIIALGVLIVITVATRRNPTEETEILAETEVFETY